MKLFVSLLYSSEIQANALLVLLLFIVHDQSKLIKNKKQKNTQVRLFRHVTRCFSCTESIVCRLFGAVDVRLKPFSSRLIVALRTLVSLAAFKEA